MLANNQIILVYVCLCRHESMHDCLYNVHAHVCFVREENDRDRGRGREREI